jgi:PAS domain S-box-containing protein
METSSCFSDASSTDECHFNAPWDGVSYSTLDLAGIGTWNWDKSSGKISVSSTWCALFGRPQSPFISREDFLGALHPDDRAAVDQQLMEALTQGRSCRVEHRVLWPDGSEHWMATTAALPHKKSGASAGLAGVCQDITSQKSLETELKKREAELARRRTQFQLILSTVEACDFEFDPVTDTGVWSVELEKLYGLQPGEFNGTLRGWKTMLVPEDLPQAEENIQRVLSEGQGTYRFRIQRRNDGKIRWLECRAKATFDQAGHPIKVVGVHIDITARVETEAALRLSQERMRAFLNNKSIVAWMKDEAGRYVFVSDHFRSRFAVGDQWEGLTDLDLWPRELADQYRQSDLAVLSTGNPLEAVQPSGHPDGSRSWWLEQKFLFIDAEGKRYVGGVALDVTEHHQVQVALLESEDRYRNLIEAAFDWIWEVDAGGRFTYSSPQVHSLLGYTPDEVVGQSLTHFMLPSEAKLFQEFFSARAALREPFSGIENINLHKKGHSVALESSGVPVLGPDGELRGYRGMDRDITARKQLEAQLRQAQKLEAIGQLAGGVAHDFNNILASMMMQIALMEMETEMAPLRAGLEDLEKEARRASNLTRQLLMFSRRSVLDKKQVDLNQVVAELLRMLGRLIGEDIRLQVESASGLPPVEADVSMMEQVLMNLVVNARDAMPRGGQISIRTSLVEIGADGSDGNLERRAGEFVCLQISDTGCGMDSGTLKRLFEPFFTTKEPGKGTGLGLATVHGIIAQHKGWVEVQSVVGSGSTFSVYLPAVASFDSIVPNGTSPGVAQRGNETILLVEDEDGVRKIVSRLLRSLGYQVLEASNGQQATRLWQLHRPEIDLLFTDMVMPEGMTGLEVVEQLQADKPDLRAIISSGYSAEIARMGVANRTGVAYLPKPSDANTMADMVRKCLDSRKKDSA